jgi:hypothetical protein
MEEKKTVKTVRIAYKCPKCETGYLRHTGRVLTTYPPQFPHSCDNPNCDYGETFSDKVYPHIEYEPIEDGDSENQPSV